MNKRTWLGALAASGLVAVLVGCGGSTGDSSSPPTTGGNPQPQPAQTGTARLDINTETGQVKVTPLNGKADSRSLYTGGAIGVASTALSTDPGELTVKKLKLTLTNNTADRLDNARISFDAVESDTGALDLRRFTSVSTIIGPGSSAADGPGPSVTITQPNGLAVDPNGVLYVSGSGDGTLRRMEDNYVTRIATGIATPGGVAVLGSSVFVLEQSAHNLVRVPAAGGTKFVMAGNGTSGLVDGSGSAARFNAPRDIEIIGTTAYIADYGNNRIRTATNLSGGSAAVGTLNVFPVINGPSGLAHFPLNGVDWLVVASSSTHKVFLVNSSNGQSFAIAGTGAAASADGDGATAAFNAPFDVAVSGGAIYVSDLGGRSIRQLSLNQGAQPQFAASWMVKTVSGTGSSGAVDGVGTTAQYAGPRFLETDNSGSIVIADLANNRVRRMTPINGAFPVTGTGTGTGQVELIGTDGYQPDPGRLDRRIPYVNIGSLEAKGVLGDSTQKEINFTVAEGVKSFYVILSVTAASSTPAALDAVANASNPLLGSPNVFVRTLAGASGSGFTDGTAVTAKLGTSTFVSASQPGIFFSDDDNHAIRFADWNGKISTIAGIRGSDGTTVIAGSGATCSFDSPTGLWSNADGTELYVVDFAKHVVCRLSRSPSSPVENPTSWTMSVIAGAIGTSGNAVGSGVQTRLNNPYGITADPTGKQVYVADYANNSVKLLSFGGSDRNNPAQWHAIYYAGSNNGASGDTDGSGTTALFRGPAAVTYSPSGDLYVAEYTGHRIRRIRSDRQVTLLAGSPTGANGQTDGFGANALFTYPRGIAVDDNGYVYASSILCIRRISMATGETRTTAGSSSSALPTDGPGNTARWSDAIWSLTYDRSHGLIATDSSGRLCQIERIVRTGQP